MCQRVIEALKRALDLQWKMRLGNVVDLRPPVIVSPVGCSYAARRTHDANRIREAIRAWNSRVEWAPKDLRNCLPMLAVKQELLNDVGNRTWDLCRAA